MGILELLETRRIYFDGGTGSLLQERGLKPGELPETWNLLRPDVIAKLHQDYLKAGADVITMNTFGINRFKFKEEDGWPVEKLVGAAAACARKAIEACGHGFAALDLGPTGKLLKPYGELEFEEACSAYKEVVRAGARAGADLIIIETMGDSYELKAAVLAAKEESSLPIFATVTLDEKGTMLTGGNVDSVTALLEGLGVDGIGLNCGLGPVQLLPFAKRMVEIASVPVLVNPNAGLPRSENGRTVYDIDADTFACVMKEMAMSGVSALGGCCGTTPEHIRKLRKLCEALPYERPQKKHRTVVSSGMQAVEFGNCPILIGERINPTGKPKLKQALRDEDMSYLLSVGLEQQESGAHVLDVNVGLPGIDEPRLMTMAVQELQSVVELPLEIDTSDMDAMEQAMRIYNGKPLINSVNGTKESMERIFPLMKHYGGAAVALCLDENGIPETADGRIAVAKKIYETAASYGIGREDLLMDALCMAVSSDKNGALTTLETVRRIKEELGGKTVLGVSNVSFGLPMREHINAAFFLMALQNGLSAGIINPNLSAMRQVYDSFLALTGLDENCGHYVSVYGPMEAERKKKKELGKKGADAPEENSREKVLKASESPNTGAPEGLRKTILQGLVKAAEHEAGEALKQKDALTVIEEELIPALDEVGKGFEKGTVFLPQLLMSAEAAKAAFAVMKEQMAVNGQARETIGTVILATVKGDIHDIGKNIVKVLLENYGFQVLDLGRDVAPEKIVEETVRGQVRVVGLSALMTTTVPFMEETIRQLREKAPWAKIMVGGAVLTKEYADSIGADAYCRDAMASVNFAMECLNGTQE